MEPVFSVGDEALPDVLLVEDSNANGKICCFLDGAIPIFMGMIGEIGLKWMSSWRPWGPCARKSVEGGKAGEWARRRRRRKKLALASASTMEAVLAGSSGWCHGLKA